MRTNYYPTLAEALIVHRNKRVRWVRRRYRHVPLRIARLPGRARHTYFYMPCPFYCAKMRREMVRTAR